MGANGGPGGPETAPVRIAAPQVITAEAGARILSPGYVTISGSVVTDVGKGRPLAAPDIDLPDGTLVPGFVDLQVNGYFGADFRTAGADGWAAVVRGLPASGTTAFLPTLITAPLGELTATLRAAAALAPRLPFGARVLGVHMEGPFISPQRRGAHNADWIITPTPAAVDALIEAAGGLLRVLTLAPELLARWPRSRSSATPGCWSAWGTATRRRSRSRSARSTARGWSPTCSMASGDCITGSRAWSARR